MPCNGEGGRRGEVLKHSTGLQKTSSSFLDGPCRKIGSVVHLAKPRSRLSIRQNARGAAGGFQGHVTTSAIAQAPYAASSMARQAGKMNCASHSVNSRSAFHHWKRRSSSRSTATVLCSIVR